MQTKMQILAAAKINNGFDCPQIITRPTIGLLVDA